MNKILALAVAMFLVSCGDTVNNYNYGNPDGAAEDAFAENDTFSADNTAEPDHTTLTDMEWDEGCNPPWPDGTEVSCGGPGYALDVDKCKLVWDKSSCTASCVDPYNQYSFEGLSSVAVDVWCNLYSDVEETEDVEEEWAPGCDPPFPDGTVVTCKTDDFVVDFCVISWDKSACTASCWDTETSSNVFWDCPAEAVSAPGPDGLGCSPLY